jgi:hypothetical protein
VVIKDDISHIILTSFLLYYIPCLKTGLQSHALCLWWRCFVTVVTAITGPHNGLSPSSAVICPFSLLSLLSPLPYSRSSFRRVTATGRGPSLICGRIFTDFRFAERMYDSLYSQYLFYPLYSLYLYLALYSLCCAFLVF